MLKEKIKLRNICHLCGEQIKNDEFTKEHIPARQFFPAEIRKQENLNLLTVPSHQGCNESYSKDEEYFYFSLYPIVRENNTSVSGILYDDLKKKTKEEPQKRFARTFLKNFSPRTKGGIYLPRGKYEYTIDGYRIQRVILKIVQGLFFYHNNIFLPIKKIMHYDLCLDENEVLEIFTISWKLSTLTYQCKQVFSYKYFSDENRHYWTLLFWDTVMFTVMAEL